MFNKKRYFLYLTVVLTLIVTGLVFVRLVKKLQIRTAEAEKTEQRANRTKNEKEEKPKEAEASAEALPVVVQDNTAQAEIPTEKDSPAIQGDQNVSAKTVPQTVSSKYPVHKNITTTFFWAGEEAGKDNKNISNLPSAWDEQWVKHFGGVDDPDKRNGVFPAKFTPKENPFYFALPYNDFDSSGKRKKEVFSLIPWAGSKEWGKLESMCKNQWIRITKGGKIAYAQWQDVGPFKEDDGAYVFGSSPPKSKTNKNAGLDVSPAVKDYLGLSDVDKTDWQFIDARNVPAGPWKQVITTSQVFWL